MSLENFKSNSYNSYEDIISSGAKNNIRAFKKVTFNTNISNDYHTNEAYKTLRTNLFFSGKNIKAVLITSCNENEGKSTISTGLAKSLADSGKKTLLIDADMRKSVMLKKSVKAGEIEGLSDVLSGLAEPENVIFNTQDPNFDVIFSGHFPPTPVELIGNGRFEKMIDEFKEIYDYIIIDSPPLIPVIDAAVIASYCDGSILVLPDRKVSRKIALTVKNQLQKSGCRILGAILNETTKHSEKYYSSKYYKNKYYGE